MFFTQINQMMNEAIDITLVIRKKEGQLMVSALPKSNGLKDEAQNHIVPLTVTGTPGELDMGFMQAIYQPMQKTTGLITNMSRFEEQADKAAANSKAAKEQKEKAAKEGKEKKEKFDKHIKAATEHEARQKFSEALAAFKQARTFATAETLKSVDNKIQAIKMKMSQGSLFEMEPIPQPQPQQAQAPMVQTNTGVQNGQPQVQQAPQIHVVRPNHGQAMNGNGGGQPVYAQAQTQPVVQNGGYPYNGAPMAEVIPEPEPELAMSADYYAHREGEYDQYPDFPGYSDNNMYNPQNV